MKILVNQRPIDFEIGVTETLKDVVSLLNKWTAEGNAIIVDLKIDGKSIQLEEAINSPLKIDEIEVLEMELQGVEEMVKEGLEEVENYLPRLIIGIDQIAELSRLKEFVEGLEWLNEVITKAGSLMKWDYNKLCVDEELIEKKRDGLVEIASLLKEKVENKDMEGASTILKDRVKPLLEGWVEALPTLIKKIPKKEDTQALLSKLKGVSSRFPDLSKEIEKISVYLQTGEMTEAMEQFQKTIDELQSMIHLLQEIRIFFDLDYRVIKVKEETIEERCQELDELLSEIITAFENEDIVMLADLLEYELSPLLSRWGEVITAVIAEVEKRIN
ncbi:TPA: hypothetical protein DCX15_04255 [bacterium]|nr:hypothetical protein [bacterium]